MSFSAQYPTSPLSHAGIFVRYQNRPAPSYHPLQFSLLHQHALARHFSASLFCLVFSSSNRRPKKASRVEPRLLFPLLTRGGGGRDMPGRSPVKTLHEPQKKKHLGFGRRFRGVFFVVESYTYLACGFSVSHLSCDQSRFLFSFLFQISLMSIGGRIVFRHCQDYVVAVDGKNALNI
jgi:hypothetical protein